MQEADTPFVSHGHKGIRSRNKTTKAYRLSNPVGKVGNDRADAVATRGVEHQHTEYVMFTNNYSSRIRIYQAFVTLLHQYLC